MGTITIGKCQCQCYINYVSCEVACDQNEIRRSNRFTETTNRSRQKKRSPGDSSERQSKFSSTRKPSSRSNSDKTKYLLSEFCNLTSESSKQSKKRKPVLHRPFIKSRSLYNFDGSLEIHTEKNTSLKVEGSSAKQSFSDLGTMRPKIESMDKGVLKKTSENNIGQQKKYVKWNLPQHYLRNRTNTNLQQEFYS